MLERIDSPFPPSAGMDHSVALCLEYEGEESWLLMSWTVPRRKGRLSGRRRGRSAPHGVVRGLGGRAGAHQDDADARGQAPPATSRFADDGSLVSSHGVEILDQVLDPDLPENFAPPEARTAAALLQGPDGKKWYVLVRDS